MESIGAVPERRLIMNEPESFYPATPEAQMNGIVNRLRRWWRLGTVEERYLETATDLVELERRMRVLERASGGPVFATFNH